MFEVFEAKGDPPQLIEIDGSRRSGSGTILRMAISLCAVKGEHLHIWNIRKKRPQPGLRPQHLHSVLAAAELCNAEVEGAEIGSSEVWFKPGIIDGGRCDVQIGTAGSIPMLFMTVLPICASAEAPMDLCVSKGGTDVRHSPTINYMRNVLLPTLRLMGVDADISVRSYGYYPKGLGEATMNVRPSGSLNPLCLDSFGRITRISGISVCTSLQRKKVAERQAMASHRYLKKRGYTPEIRIVNDTSQSLQKGSSITLVAETDEGALLGADRVGEIRKTSEAVGEEAAAKLFREISAKATVDCHLADMLIPYMAIAEGRSVYLTRTVSSHVETNIWLAEEILNVSFTVKRAGRVHTVEKAAQPS